MSSFPARTGRLRRRRFAAVTMTVVFALLMAGCSFSCSIGEDPTVTSSEMADRIEQSYVEETGIELDSLSCEPAPAEVGGAISCEGTNVSEVDLVIEGEITAVDEGEDTVDFDWEVTSAQVPGAHYAQASERLIEERSGQPVTAVECPDRVDLEEGGEFRCTVIAPDGAEYGATVTMTDMDGGFNINVDENATGADAGSAREGA